MPQFYYESTIKASAALEFEWHRDPAAIERSVGVDPQRIDVADQLIEGGAQQVTLGFNGPDFDMSMVAEWLAWRDQMNAA